MKIFLLFVVFIIRIFYNQHTYETDRIIGEHIPYGQGQVAARLEHHIYVFGMEWLNNELISSPRQHDRQIVAPDTVITRA